MLAGIHARGHNLTPAVKVAQDKDKNVNRRRNHVQNFLKSNYSRTLLRELMDYAYAVERLIILPDQFTGKKSPELLELLSKYAHELNRKSYPKYCFVYYHTTARKRLCKDLPSLQVTIAMSVLLLDELIAHAWCCQPTKPMLLLKNVICIEPTDIEFQVSSYVDRHMKGLAPGSQIINTVQTSRENTNQEHTSSDVAEDVPWLRGNLRRLFVARFCSDCRKPKERYSEEAVMDTLHNLEFVIKSTCNL